ncbi:sel1 repeat family protein [Haemophilus influenzae]|uniref:tetratricopeptide repeat protein n=1 Tax=Haemophilus influenzae TaxID=727 RepID=UPI000E349D80|nr:tetratricopeptide repeat protein [Haemophilus influenzae]MCK9666939.1 sel1 repeat family protein [Haemophilus influenzae]RFN76609.1 sel1 repeat family protein [Haemophilus influenzae]RFO04437.1 sel1 repeat family protein [Haemophilus influenzae]
MKLTKTLLTTALLGASVFSFQSTAWADTPVQQFQQGLTAYEQSDYQTAFKLWLPLAEQGNADAQFNLGLMYYNGRGVKQDDFEAVKWYRKAAEQGNVYAQFNLGNMYHDGRGVKQDDVESVKWYRKAAEQGNVYAQFIVGGSYLLGKGVQVNKSLAKEWFGKACDNGDQDGCEYYSKLNRGEL